jgi:type II restriction enzyme
MESEDRVARLVQHARKLSPVGLELVELLAGNLSLPIEQWRAPGSDVIPTDRALDGLGCVLRTHHLFSGEPFRREKLEYALERVASEGGRDVARAASRTNRGYDLSVDSEKWSLKSQADKGIRRDVIWISKWMELGKGEWGANEQDLRRLCRMFIEHLRGYDRVFVLRCLTPTTNAVHAYELLEIPKPIMQLARKGDFRMMHESRQFPKPGYCTVSDTKGVMYELYFDGGTERKLQVKNLRRDLCRIHATWQFAIA